MHHSPSGGAGRGTASADGRLVSIGTVLNLLRDEFPEVTISKIRFLETEGLVEPQRTPSGYRKFSAQDVERLGQVLRMQRDHYLPLKVIREHLDALQRGETVPLPAPAQPRDLLDGERGAVPPEQTAVRIGRAELLMAAEAGEAELTEWESYGLLSAASDGAYDAGAIGVAKLIAELGRAGLEPRHLRAIKAAADREAGLVEQLVAPLRRHRNPQTRAHAEATARELAGLSVRLHAALVEAALRVRLH
ncbi:transcriptional regulator FtsR [Streptomyces zagrosensis]|uniref:DNA-binding transcriptional MerR regulator n=1 Tax=Streptomyces zagrosensis TaxID=1042984 RepID=A0A7W9V1R2_9ACTN|nr:MerR family transcriptional regulator [Streptomyces zagrosensis]MBB5938506.1 DNA-binding transcriptional MerR regulator [Streptomyces zagrosensis]